MSREYIVSKLKEFGRKVNKRHPKWGHSIEIIDITKKIERDLPEVIREVTRVLDTIPEWLYCNFENMGGDCYYGPSWVEPCSELERCKIFWRAMQDINELEEGFVMHDVPCGKSNWCKGTVKVLTRLNRDPDLACKYQEKCKAIWKEVEEKEEK